MIESLSYPTGGVAPVQVDETWKVEHKELCPGVERKDIVEALNRRAFLEQGETKSDFLRLSQRFADCGESYRVHQCDNHSCNGVHISGSRCESKICPECGKKRIGKLLALNMEKLKSMSSDPHAKVRPAHLVLTFMNVSPEIYRTREYHRWMRKCVTEFFNDSFIKKRLLGALWSIESKRPQEGYVYSRPGRVSKEVGKGRLYNTHVHAFIESEFIPAKAGRSRILNNIWHRITGDSYITHIKQVKNTIAALTEAVKYVIAPGNLGDADSYVDYLVATKNMKSYVTVGSFQGHFKLTEKSLDYKYRRCDLCNTTMKFISKISKTEALRYYHLVKGPPIDRYGRYTNLGYPQTLSLLRNCDPLFRDKIPIGGFN